MYVNFGGSSSEKVLVEPMCYDADHIEKVTDVIKENFETYFNSFLDTEAGSVISYLDFIDLQQAMKTSNGKSKKKNNRAANFRSILSSAIDAFEKDKQNYIDLFDSEMLEEYEEDPASFKSTALKKECPIIRKTLNSKVKELKKYQIEFCVAKPQELLEVVKNISNFSKDYYKKSCINKMVDSEEYSQLGLTPLDKDEKYTVYGVIGGGIKSHMMYKNYPSLFANRSQNAIWALYYLSGQKTFGCRMDSEFLMIDNQKRFITQQNYFYPYELFSHYANVIYRLICKKAEEYDVFINPDYKYVIVDCFLNFVASEHSTDIFIFKTQIKERSNSHAYA